MILFPNAKINLGLHVLSKRRDNFHNLETLMHPVGICDILEFIPSPENETHLKITGIPVSGDMQSNLVYRAYALLRDLFKLPPLRIHLHKIIPAGAGLGGGSSDAAFMLKGLNQFFDLGLSSEELKIHAASLGSDCSFFVENVPAIASGKGEILVPAANYLHGCKLLLFFPGFPVSTAEAYSGILPDPDKESLTSILEQGLSSWRGELINDFEKTVFEKYPELRTLKEALYGNGALYASMSGSGSALYGLFDAEYAISPELKKGLVWEGLL